MEPLKFDEIRQLLKACRVVELSDRPKVSEKSQWDLYSGEYKVHAFSVPFELLYFYSDVRRDQIIRAKTTAFKSGETIVVYAPSSNVSSLRDTFEKEAKGFWNTTEYLASFMAEPLSAYRKRLVELKPENWIRPSLEVPRGTVHSVPNPVESFLTDPSLSTEGAESGSLAVVLAEAGHGKTYMCEWLVASLAEKNQSILPIYVSSSQWKQLRSEDLLSLETMLVSSFRALGAPIPWVDGQEDLFLKVALKAGLFRVVFDGFDEYALRNPGEISGIATLEALAKLAADTGTRVVVTSRTSFWHSEFESSNQDLPNVHLFTLQPFDRNQARNYFKLKLKNAEDKVNSAVEIFSDLSSDDPTFAGRGFVLLLIADLVNSGVGKYSSSRTEKPLMRLMRALCERETLRHELPINAEQQLLGLQNFVFDVAQGEPNDSSTFGLAMQLAMPNGASELNSDAVNRLLDKMAPHALVERKSSKWEVRVPQVQTALLAQRLIALSQDDAGVKLLEAFSRRGTLDAGDESDLGAMLTGLCQWQEIEKGGVAVVQNLIRAFFEASAAPLHELPRHTLRKLATHIALRVLEASDSKTHVDRIKFLENLFPKPAFEGVVFFGSLAKFDCRGQTFRRSVFDNVRWANCKFDGESVFSDCYLLGGASLHCDGFASAQWNNVQADETGQWFLDGEAVLGGKRRYTEDDLKRDVVSVLEKFVGKGGVGFKSVDEANLGRGKVAVSPHKSEIIDVIKRSLLEEHHISGGTQKGTNLTDVAREPVRVLLTNNLITGCLINVFDDLVRRIDIAK